MENETIKERFLGTIFGQAVGDALGLSTELCPSKRWIVSILMG
jgi:ADP-ribosylglycohydrolase